jgi:sporulation protein YlmC with PRC-barrel domain
MEQNSKPLTKDALVSMQVIDARGRLVGKIRDVVFGVGKMGVSLAVENEEGKLQNVGWEDVQAAADFIILKPQAAQQTAYQPQQQASQNAYQPQPQVAAQPAQQPQQTQTQPLCPTCQRPLTWIAQYQRWYCYNEKKYV